MLCLADSASGNNISSGRIATERLRFAVSADGESTEQWSVRFGTQIPVLLFASDLDVACSYAQDHREEIEHILVWPEPTSGIDSGSIAKFESRVRATSRDFSRTFGNVASQQVVWSFEG